MKYLKLILPLLLIFFVCSSFKNPFSSIHFKDFFNSFKSRPVYVYGVAASFADSVVYFTEVQQMDSVKLTKEGYLPDRVMYSYQLRDFLEVQKGLKNRTCMIYFSHNDKKLKKAYVKLLKRYEGAKAKLQTLDKEAFKFQKPVEEGNNEK